MGLQIKRVYDAPERTDGCRMLVDRMWPRGVSKEKAKIDLWLRDIAPGNELRKWFSHDPEKWSEFRGKYFEQLKEKKDLIDLIRTKTKEGTVTLLYAAKNEKYNNAVCLREFILSRK